MAFDLPPVVKLAERLLVEVEEAVSRFPRRHKYVHGAALREKAMDVAELAHKAWRDRKRQARWISRLVWAVDGLKLRLQLAMQINAISFKQFEHLARELSDLGRQVGGWYKQQQHLKGQSPASASASERSPILSASAASSEAQG